MIEHKLWDHQKKGVERALQGKEFAFYYDAGTGKTLTTITVLRHIFARNKQLLRTLVLAPVIVLENWKEEWAKFSKVNQKHILVLIGPTKKRIAKLSEGVKRYGSQLIIITNYESLVASKEFFAAISEWHPQCMVIDESQRIKSYNSKTTKLVTELADFAQYKYLLTGTPILNTPMDIYSQFRALDGGETFGHNFFSFRAKFFYDKNAGMPSHVHFPKWVIREDAHEELNKKIYTKAARAVKSECLDLPPLVKTKIFVDLPPNSRKMYEQMKEEFVTFLEDRTITADIALTKTLRMLQICNGFIKDSDGKVSSIASPKKEALKELLKDICQSEKVIVWCCFKDNYSQVRDVCEKLKIKYVEAHGGITNTRKYLAVERFNTDPDTKLFIGHPGSLGVGINLIAASHSIYFSRSYNLEHDVQSEARNYRGGSEIHQKVTRIDLVARETIDEQVIQASEDKVVGAEKILAILKKEIITHDF